METLIAGCVSGFIAALILGIVFLLGVAVGLKG